MEGGCDGAYSVGQAERDRIVEVHRSAVMETFKLMLGAGMPGGTPHERQKTRWIIKGFEMATDALKRAIDETGTPLDREGE